MKSSKTIFIVIALSWLLMGGLCVKKPPNPMALMQQNACVQNLEVRDYERAQIRCQICLEYDDSVPACLNGLGLVSYARHDDEMAESYFSRALRQDKHFAQAFNNLGAVYFRQGRFSKALSYFEDAVKIDPGYQDARYNFGLTYLRLGQQAQEKEQTKDALAYYDKAETQLRSLTELHPNSADGYREVGLLFTYRAQLQPYSDRQTQSLAQAVSYFEQCLQVEPLNEGCNESLGHTLLTQQQYDKALYAFVQCLAANRHNGVCIAGTDAATQGSVLNQSALRRFVAQLKENPNNANAHYAYCEALFDNNLDQLAVAECDTALRLDKQQCLPHYALGMYYKKVFNAPMALEQCRAFTLCAHDKRQTEKINDCQAVILASS